MEKKFYFVIETTNLEKGCTTVEKTCLSPVCAYKFKQMLEQNSPENDAASAYDGYHGRRENQMKNSKPDYERRQRKGLASERQLDLISKLERIQDNRLASSQYCKSNGIDRNNLSNESANDLIQHLKARKRWNPEMP